MKTGTSQLFPAYESHVIRRMAFGKYPYSLSTWVKYHVRGSARRYGDIYERGLRRACEVRGWRPIRSEKSRRPNAAYCPVHLLPEGSR